MDSVSVAINTFTIGRMEIKVGDQFLAVSGKGSILTIKSIDPDAKTYRYANSMFPLQGEKDWKEGDFANLEDMIRIGLLVRK